MSASSQHVAFRRARDFLFAHRDDYDAAYAGFRWPDLGAFNWALDWFDIIARDHGDRPALRLVTDDDHVTTRTYGELSASSSRVANSLRTLGVKRGDRVLVMLGNELPMWETILATMNLGAVVIPATTQLTPRDLEDRFARGRVAHVIATDSAVFAPRFLQARPQA